MCRIAPEQSYGDLKISVQGYYQGVVQIESDACGVSIVRRYENNELVSVPTPPRAQTNCLFTFQVFPDYPNNSGVVVSGFRGHLWVRMLPKDQAWVPHVLKKKGYWTHNLSFFSGGVGPVQVTALGCGNDYFRPLPLTNGYLKFPVHEAVNPVMARCILEGLIVNPEYKNLQFSIIIAQYSTLFAPLPLPVVKVVGKELQVTGDASTGVIALDEFYSMGKDAKFSFDPTKTHVLRLLTAKGRSVLGEYNPSSKSWRWQQ